MQDGDCNRVLLSQDDTEIKHFPEGSPDLLCSSGIFYLDLPQTDHTPIRVLSFASKFA